MLPRSPPWHMLCCQTETLDRQHGNSGARDYVIFHIQKFIWEWLRGCTNSRTDYICIPLSWGAINSGPAISLLGKEIDHITRYRALSQNFPSGVANIPILYWADCFFFYFKLPTYWDIQSKMNIIPFAMYCKVVSFFGQNGYICNKITLEYFSYSSLCAKWAILNSCVRIL